jgi:hypothetical protein
LLRRDRPAPPRQVDAEVAADFSGAVELAARQSDGLEVALLWNRRSGLVWVDVLHVASGESLIVEAEPSNALDVYYHPFAYCLGEAA